MRLLVVVVVVLLAVATVNAQGGLEAIERLDLSKVRVRVMKEQNWSEDKSNTVLREYRRFWALRFKHPGQWLVPSPDVDEIWHAHILHTREYTRDCESVFGPDGYLHHEPSYGEEQRHEDRTAYRKLLNNYVQDFGEQPPAKIWGLASGACGGGCGGGCGAPTKNESASCSMQMYFGATENVCVWLASWHVTNGAQFAGAVIGILAGCALREWITAYRQKRHQNKSAERRRAAEKDQRLLDSAAASLNSPSRVGPSALEIFIESTWYAINIVIAYLLMLLIMTYNIGICLTIILGLWAFNFLFTFIYSRSGADIKPPEADHCCDEGNNTG